MSDEPTGGPAAAARITGLILAGGRGRRMGGADKGLLPLAGRPLVAHVLAALDPQVARVIVSANRNLDRYRALGVEVIPDQVPGHAGPLAGLAAGLAAADTTLVLCVPCDAPLLCPDLAARLRAALARSRARIAVAHDGKRLQPLFALLERGLQDDLEGSLAAGERRVAAWVGAHRPAVCDFSDRPEAFFNCNDPRARAALAAHLAGRQS